MKKVILVLLGMLALSPATFAYQSKGQLSQITSPKDNVKVTGKVVDEQGNPLPGASVYVKGTTNGTISDIDGNFTLEAPSDGTLVFTFVGYTSQEIQLNGRSTLGNVTMQEDNQEIEQVVVIGYGTQKKVDLTGSVAVVDADEMKKVSNSNISTMLEGKVAGVQITSDGQPGADPSVRIRGIGSFGSTAPLYVIDGVPMGTTIRDFSPNDIASIQILKDASAAAIYGSRAANGVVIITTKQGKKSQPMKIDYSGYFGIDKINSNVYDVMDADQFIGYVQTGIANSKDLLNTDYTTPTGYDPNSADYLLGKINTNWFDEVFKTGTRQNHNVNLSGGSETSTYNIGLDYYDQKGTLEGAGPNYTRYTARVNNTMDVKFIKLKTSLVYSHSDQDNMALSNASEYVQGMYGSVPNMLASATLGLPTMPAYDENSWVLDGTVGAANAYNYDAYGYGVANETVLGAPYASNPLLLNNKLERHTNVDRIAVTANANVDLFKMLGFSPANHKLSYNINLAYNKTYCKYYTWIASWIQTNNVYLAKENERLTEQYTNYSDGLLENTINYEGTIADKNHISFVIGQTFEKELYHQLTGIGISFPEPYFLQIQNASDKDANSSETEHTLASYIGRLNYDYDQKYLLSATVRRDGSSRLSSADRWGWFPSVSLGWRIDREDFFPVDDHLISLLKLRGSYGILGNENIGEYQYMVSMARQNMSYSFGGNAVYGSAVSTFVNQNIAWEKKKSTSIGFDLNMLNNQIEFTFEYYKNVSEDLLYSVPVPETTGVSNETVTMNAASMENSGFEWSAAYHNYKHQIKYDVNFNLSTLKNKVTSLGFGTDTYITGDYYTEVGCELGQFYGYRYCGLLTQDKLDELNAYAQQNGHSEYQTGAAVGDMYYEDLNGDGQITSDDREVLGSGMPKVNFGLSARAEYKGFDLTVSTYGALGFHVTDYLYNVLTNPVGIAENKSPEVLDGSWGNIYASTAAQTMAWNTLFSERKIQNASYWKIANVELGYNFKDAWFHGIVNNVRVYVSGQNLATITKYIGYNVDYAAGTFTPGYNYCSYPTPVTVMFGLQASF